MMRRSLSKSVVLIAWSLICCIQVGALRYKTLSVRRAAASALLDTTQNTVTSEIFSLDSIRSTLVRQEETIIFALIERAQYFSNAVIYDCKMGQYRNTYGTPLSFLEYMLLETEKLHAKVRRYTSPEEHPFFPTMLPSPILPPLNYPEILTGKTEVNVNNELLRWHVEKIIKRLCKPGDDEQHGSSVLCDINVLQALSRRVHFGKFVAESKYLENPKKYEELVAESNVQGIISQLTNIEVERRVLRRAFVKASTYGQDVTGLNEGYKVDPMLIVDIYKDLIIPLTKDVEVRYLFLRMGVDPPAPDTYYYMCQGPADAFDDPESLKALGNPVK